MPSETGQRQDVVFIIRLPGQVGAETVNLSHGSPPKAYSTSASAQLDADLGNLTASAATAVKETP